MKYRLPSYEDEDSLIEYVREHHKNGETSISASLGLASTDYAEWVDMVCENVTMKNGEWGRSLLYLCVEEERIIGLLSIRPELPKELSEKYGDVGVGVRPSERRKGYAYKMLQYALDVCRQYGMKEVVLGCYEDNIPSSELIKKCGGILFAQNDNYREGRTGQYYRVRL